MKWKLISQINGKDSSRRRVRTFFAKTSTGVLIKTTVRFWEDVVYPEQDEPDVYVETHSIAFISNSKTGDDPFEFKADEEEEYKLAPKKKRRRK